jgi:hypothetical protein
MSGTAHELLELVRGDFGLPVGDCLARQIRHLPRLSGSDDRLRVHLVGDPKTLQHERRTLKAVAGGHNA